MKTSCLRPGKIQLAPMQSSQLLLSELIDFELFWSGSYVDVPFSETFQNILINLFIYFIFNFSSHILNLQSDR